LEEPVEAGEKCLLLPALAGEKLSKRSERASVGGGTFPNSGRLVLSAKTDVEEAQ